MYNKLKKCNNMLKFRIFLNSLPKTDICRLLVKNQKRKRLSHSLKRKNYFF